MLIIGAIISFILGACLGSFFNVVIERTQRGEDFVKKSSHCDTCQKKLTWFDNIPLLSFLILGGKCRFCKSKIGRWHLVMEILGAVLFLGWWLVFNQDFLLSNNLVTNFLFLILANVLLIIVVTDLRFMIIPNWSIVLILLVEMILAVYLISGQELTVLTLIFGLVTALLVGGFFYGLDWLALKIWKQPGMGMGDVKLVLVLTILIFLTSSWQMLLVMLMLAFTSGAVVGVLLKVLRKKNKPTVLPFGPFLIGATGVVLVWGEELNDIFQLFF